MIEIEIGNDEIGIEKDVNYQFYHHIFVYI